MSLYGSVVLRAVRNIMRDLTIQPNGIYNVPVTAFSDVGIGRRHSASNRLVASVLMQTTDSRIVTLGQYQWDFTVIVEMFYRVGQDVETAELTLADAYPAAMDTFYKNKTLIDPDTQEATVRDSKVTGPASNPWYESLASQEYRMQVVFLNCWKRETFPPVQP